MRSDPCPRRASSRSSRPRPPLGRRRLAWSCALLGAFTLVAGARAAEDPDAIRARFDKREAMVPMRDGVRLFTSIYAPKDRSRRWPILMTRTPYGVGPYGEDAFRGTLGPHPAFVDAGYAFVYQDVRGCSMSEGTFVNMTPHRDVKTAATEIDESSDTFDTIAWLLDNVPNHNGKVGLYGISYPGFYAAAGMIDAHPALAAVSPQAPIADWYFDDFHHHGAFFLAHAFNFFSSFGLPREAPTTARPPRFDYGTVDGYQFYLDAGPLRNLDERYLKGRVAYWTELAAHPDYDAYWSERNLLPHLRHVAPAVLTVGGLFDAEDLYGPLAIYRSVERANPGIVNALVLGPWKHGGWARTDGDALGQARFGAKTSAEYQAEIELPFFEHYLKGTPGGEPPEATVFETGTNRWRRFDAWPPAHAAPRTFYLGPGFRLGDAPPAATLAGADLADSFVSDPARPVPFTNDIAIGMTPDYMAEDQRFASRRPDVLAYATEPLVEPLTLAGPLDAALFVSTTARDADWVVKLIDVYPPDAADPPDLRPGQHMGGAQMMVRSEVLRGRYREGYAAPKPFDPGVAARVDVPLQDVLHTFGRGHRLMIQVQSTWFPLVDRNPQSWVDNIFEARPEDFVTATHRVLHAADAPSALHVLVLPPDPPERTAREGSGDHPAAGGAH